MNKKDKQPMKAWKTVALPGDLVEKLRVAAQAQDRSLSWYLRYVVELHFNTAKK